MRSEKDGSELERREFRVRGTVQGVGFRPFVYRLARELDLVGWVLNDTEGVRVQAEGTSERLALFAQRLRDDAPRLAVVERVESRLLPLVGERDFRILASPPSGSRQTVVPPDVATCGDCLREMWNPRDRRYRYPFLNCTNCGPRYSIIEGLPYDRPRTSMKRFAMCRDCEEEYHDPADRRFHAQPTACPACGPSLVLTAPDASVIATADGALHEARGWLADGKVVALKGVGGFQLLVNASDEEAVARLRVRKQRGRKPFAVMFPDLASVRAAAEVDSVAESAFESPACPIVLVELRADGAPLAPSVAPGNPNVGAMVPYSPLHHLLLREVGGPLVATSGNLSDEPICIGDEEARTRLRGLADVFLTHDREVVRPVDDSVTRVVRGRLQILRRARGYAPLALGAGHPVPAVLAVGPQLKNTVAVGLGDQVVVSQHLGDLDNDATYASFRRAIDDLRQFYEFTPRFVAHDAHPDYLSTRYALESGLPTVAVQHHYAHVLSCLADAGADPPVLGVAWDGTGYGTDGTVWGGEFLRVDADGFERVGHLRTFPLVGGDAAVREPRRSAAGVLFELEGPSALDPSGPALAPFDPAEGRVVAQLLRRSFQVVPTSSAGRLFDAVASLLGLVQRNDFEGEAAMALEFAAGTVPLDPTAFPPYPYRVVESGSDLELDWGPIVSGLIEERSDVRRAAARFHVTLASGIVDIARRLGERRVALTGGCFQNRHLTELTLDGLRDAGLEPIWHARVPPNDGGISVGQVMAAARVKTRGRIDPSHRGAARPE
ncbi:MAG TPA: carbamoyltransferase HypF [Thermoplasmata archaeon]|nr:carbamoyltransferase HypF [Thermoplasmata archaeon]